jgi:transglutaminase-like putative cysteine protease
MKPQLSDYLSPTAILDADHPDIIKFAKETIGPEGFSQNHISIAIKLYYEVRDTIWYDPYAPFYKPEHYRSSNILKTKRAFCVGKAGLLCTLGRACGIPSRLGYVDVINHLATKQLIEFLGNDLFSFHGFTEFYLNEKWVKATPAFNRELCIKHKVTPLEFDGHRDSIFHPYNEEKKQFMEYVNDHGVYADIPVDKIVAGWEKAYGATRMKTWIENIENSGGKSARDFASEDVLK